MLQCCYAAALCCGIKGIKKEKKKKKSPVYKQKERGNFIWGVAVQFLLIIIVYKASIGIKQMKPWESPLISDLGLNICTV